ncbi:hypothetical protein ACTXT7_010289 [Hymenolepis weldensis]
MDILGIPINQNGGLFSVSNNRPKNKPSTSKSTPPASAPTKIVKVLVNPLETDPYDELPTVFEVPPAVPPHPNKMEQSFYANLYENYPTGGASEGRNGSPHSRQPSSSPRPTSPKVEEIPGKTVSFFGTASTNTKTTLPVMQASTDFNSKHNQNNLWAKSHYSYKIMKIFVYSEGFPSIGKQNKNKQTK